MRKIALLAMITIIVLSTGVVSVLADQVFRILHHESQGRGDPSFTKCMPEAAWNGHKHHEGDWQGDICIPDGDDGDDDGDGDDGGNGDGDDGNGGNGVVGGNGGVSNPLGCWMNFQLYGRADDRQIDAAYVAAAWSAENPDVVSVGEGEVINLYSVSNGVAASPPGQTFVAIATGGLGDVDGYGTVFKCSGYLMVDLFDAAGSFVGHVPYSDTGTIGKGFHAINSGEAVPLDFLDMGFSLP